MSAPPQQLWGFPAESFPAAGFPLPATLFHGRRPRGRGITKKSVKTFAHVLPLHHEPDHVQVFTLWFSSRSWKLAKGNRAGSLGLQKVIIHIKWAATNQVINGTLSEAVLCSCFPDQFSLNWLNIHFFSSVPFLFSINTFTKILFFFKSKWTLGRLYT